MTWTNAFRLVDTPDGPAYEVLTLVAQALSLMRQMRSIRLSQSILWTALRTCWAMSPGT